MGDLRAGDVVFGIDGAPCSVVATSGLLLGRPCRQVGFSDGAWIVADAGHVWRTMTLQERSQTTRLTPEFREKRRGKRPSRANGTRPHVGAMNSEREYEYKAPPFGGLRTTDEVAATLAHQGRANHHVPCAGAAQYAERDLPIDPYLLGVWLGDGGSISGNLTSADLEVAEAFVTAGYHVAKHASKYSWGIHGFAAQLRKAGLLKNKHIPVAYLQASVPQRLALLQGLMDTDGCIAGKGACEFTTTSKPLAEGMGELLASLGTKSPMQTGTATLNGRKIGPKWRFKFRTALACFRLARKASKQKRDGFRGTHDKRYVISVEPVESRPVCCIQVDAEDGMFLCGREFIPTHNSDALLMAALQFVDVPGYAALLLRRTFAELTKPNALMDRASDWLMGTAAQWHASKSTWVFPSGATLSFGYLANDGDLQQYQSAEYQFVGFDELTHFSEKQYRYLFSRQRRLATAQVPIRMRAASNPGGPGHEWVRQRFVDEPREPDRVFIPARLSENPHLDREEYEQALNELDPVTRAQLLDGTWDVRTPGSLFKREWFGELRETVPKAIRWTRFWDLAATAPKPGKDPDHTAGALVGLLGEGLVCIADMRRAQSDPAGVERLICDTANTDGRGVAIRMEQEPGATGKMVIADFAKKLVGYDFAGVPSMANKLERARPVSAAAANGLITVVRGPWNMALFDELECFPSVGVHDDQVDAVSGGFADVTAPVETTRSIPLVSRASFQV